MSAPWVGPPPRRRRRALGGAARLRFISSRRQMGGNVGASAKNARSVQVAIYFQVSSPPGLFVGLVDVTMGAAVRPAGLRERVIYATERRRQEVT